MTRGQEVFSDKWQQPSLHQLQAPPMAKAPSLGPLKVLLVDDDQYVCELAQWAFGKAGGFQVKAVFSGEEALESLGSGPAPDLVILDQNMPGMNGIQTLEKIRVLHPDLPVLISSGQPDIEEWTCFKQPKVAVISKPFEIGELLAKVAAFTQHSTSFPPKP